MRTVFPFADHMVLYADEPYPIFSSVCRGQKKDVIFNITGEKQPWIYLTI